MKIIITGATGSLGAALTRYYSNQGHQVIACGRTNSPPENLLKYASYLNIDINNSFEFPEADVCIHTAALSDDKAKYSDLYTPNVIGTLNTLNAAKKVKKFIHISSSSVYLPHPTALTEDMAGKQNNKLLSPYGKSKLEAEKVLIKNVKHESCFILRPRAFYGVGDRVILPRILKLVKNDVFSRPGEMKINVTLTHYNNIAKAIDLCIESNKKGVNIYNVGDDHPYVFVDVIRKIIKSVYQKPIQEKVIGLWVLKLMSIFKIGGITPLLVRSFSQDMTLDISKIKRELNYTAVADLDSKLSELTEWIESIGGVDALKSGDKKYAWLP